MARHVAANDINNKFSKKEVIFPGLLPILSVRGTYMRRGGYLPHRAAFIPSRTGQSGVEARRIAIGSKGVRHKIAPVEAHRQHPRPVARGDDDLGGRAAGPHTSRNEIPADPMIRRALQRRDLPKGPAAEAPHTQHLRKMRPVDEGDLDRPVAIQIRRPDGRKPPFFTVNVKDLDTGPPFWEKSSKILR